MEEMAKEEIEDELKSVEQRCVYLYKKALIDRVYSVLNINASDDYHYFRTRKLIDSVRSRYENGVITIYHDLDSIEYLNYNRTIVVTEQVPYWVNYGHGGIWDYQERKFLELAKEYIENELGVTVQIVNPEPPRV
jgi:hypothetical protein